MTFNRINIGGGRVARMYQLAPHVLKDRLPVQIRPGLDPSAVLGQRWSARLSDLGILSSDTVNVAGFYNPELSNCFNPVFKREEFFLLNSEGIVRRSGDGTGEIMCVNDAIVITVSRLADYQYFDSIYGEYHDQVAQAIRSLMSGAVAGWNSFRETIYNIESACYRPIPPIDLSGACFEDLDLREANLRMVALNWARFNRVHLGDADLSSTQHLYAGVKFTGVIKNAGTIMPWGCPVHRPFH